MKRLIYGFSLFFGALFSLIIGGVVWPIFLCTVSFMAGEEYIAMIRAKGMHPSANIIRTMIIVFFAATAIPAIPQLHLSDSFAIDHFPFLLTFGVCLSFFRLLFRQRGSQLATISDIATTILGFIYLGWMPSHLILVRNLHLPGIQLGASLADQPGLAYVWATSFIIWSTDVFAYYSGKLWGKHLLYPQISPKKTIEGAIGGLVASILMSLLVVYLADFHIFHNMPFRGNLWLAPLMAIYLSVGAQLGDLCESLLKRDAGLKDSGNLIPGHGGFLDRGDSLIFGSALAYYWICFFILGTL